MIGDDGPGEVIGADQATAGDLAAEANEAVSSASRISSKRGSRSMRAGWLVVGILPLSVLALLAFMGYIHYSTQVEPDFYREAMRIEPEQYRQAGEAFESRLLQLNTDVRNQQEWVVSFTAEQINGWLAFEMPRKLPHLLPKEITDPRVAFDDHDVKAAFRLNTPAWSGVVNLRASVFCTEQPNQLAVQIHRLSSGIVPLPLETWSDSIQKGFRKAGIELEWSQMDGLPVALVTLPEEYLDIDDRQIVVQTLEIDDGQVLLSGTSLTIDPSARVSQLPDFMQLLQQRIEPKSAREIVLDIELPASPVPPSQSGSSDNGSSDAHQ